MHSIHSVCHYNLLAELRKSISEQEAEIKKLVGDSNAMSQKLSKDPDFVRFDNL